MNPNLPLWTIAGESVGVVGTQPARSRGDTGTFECIIEGESGNGHLERYEELMSREPHAGEYVSYQAVGTGRMYYREQHDRESLLVGVEPPADTLTGRGWWGVIDAIEDSTTYPQSVCEFSVSLLYLADRDEFASKARARDALETRGPQN